MPDPASLNVTRPSVDGQPRYGERVRPERGCRRRPVDGAGAIEAEADLRRDETQLGGPDLAAQQWPKPDFKLDGVGTNEPRLTGGADFDVAQLEMRGRQDPRLDRSVDAHRKPGEPAGLGFERRTVLIPIDHERRDQRGHERQDDSDGQSEQRGLHGKLPFIA